MHRTCTVFIALAASLLVAACSDASGSDGASSGGESSGGASTGGASSGGSSADGRSPLAPDFASLEECLVNRWLLVADQADRAFQTTGAPGVTTSTTGQAIVVIALDGTYTYTPDFTVELQTPAGPATGRMSGSTRGTWSLRESSLVTTETENTLSGEATGEFGSVPLPRRAGFGSMTSTVRACNTAYFEYEVAAPTGTFTQRLVSDR